MMRRVFLNTSEEVERVCRVTGTSSANKPTASKLNRINCWNGRRVVIGIGVTVRRIITWARLYFVLGPLYFVIRCLAPLRPEQFEHKAPSTKYRAPAFPCTSSPGLPCYALHSLQAR